MSVNSIDYPLTYSIVIIVSSHLSQTLDGEVGRGKGTFERFKNALTNRLGYFPKVPLFLNVESVSPIS